MEKDDINSLEHCSAMWENYVAQTSAQDRAAFVQGMLTEERTLDGWQRMKMYFAPDRTASLQIFRAWVKSCTAADDLQEPGYDMLMVNDILQSCCKVTRFGTSWDMDKAEMAYEILGSVYPALERRRPGRLETIASENARYETSLQELSDSITASPLVVRFSVPMTYFHNEEMDEPQYIDRYPDTALRKVEREFLQINYEDGLAGDHDNLLPLRAALSFSEDGRTALFKFTATDKYDAARREDIVKAAKEWLSGQLSDGFAEDMTRHEVLVGNHVLAPGFREDGMREEDVIFAGRERDTATSSARADAQAILDSGQ